MEIKMNDQILFEKFIQHLEIEKESSPNTVKSYSAQLRGYLRFLMECGLDALRVTKTDIVDYLTQRKAAGNKASSRFVTAISIKRFHQFLRQEEYTPDNPARHLELPKLEERLPQVFSIEQIERFLDMPVGSKFNRIRNRAMAELMYETGIRVTELINLRLTDLNLELGWIKVMGKGQKERTVPFGPKAKRTIDEYLVLRGQRFPSEDGVLFLNAKGQKLTRGGFWWIIKKLSRAAGLNGSLHPHRLRHSFASHMIWGGASVQAVQKSLGHKKITTTEIYTRVTPEFLKKTFESCHPRA